MQGFSGLVIFLFIPLYAAAVLIGISRMLEVNLGLNYHLALLLFTGVLALYVITGGLKAVMYTDAFQGSIMFLMMLFLLFFTYNALGGFTSAHEALGGLAQQVPEKLQGMGMRGWTQGIDSGSPPCG